VTELDGVSARALSDTICAIYDCALDPHQWPNTCRKIVSLCESTACGICVHDLRHTQNDQLFVFGYEMDLQDPRLLPLVDSLRKNLTFTMQQAWQ
jgi:hypothetical protein